MKENKSSNYTKIFLAVFLAIFLAGLLISPAKKLLTEFGIIEQEDRANYIDPTVHEGPFADALNAISAAQAQVDDTYINYIPFFTAIVDGVADAKHTVNAPFNSWLSDLARNASAQGGQSGQPSGGGSVAENSSSMTEGTTSAEEELFSPSMGVGSVENGGGSGSGKPSLTSSGTSASSSATSSTVSGSGQNQKPAQSVGVYPNFIKKSGSYSFFTFDFTTASGKSGHFLDKIITTTSSGTTSPSVAGATKMNRLAASVPNVNFYVYVCTRLNETSLREETLSAYPGGNKENLTAFLSALNSNIGKDYFKVDTLEDRIGKVYLTDHHWNAAGLDEAYGEIISMMKKKYTAIPAKRIGTKYTVKPKYYGTYVNDMTSIFDVKGFCAENNLFDIFDFYDYNLPSHTQNGGVPFATSKAKYLASGFTGEGVKDFYNDFYQAADSYYYPGNSTGHNLPILGDSFSVSVSELLASHFDRTYFKDIRNVNSENPLNLSQFVSANNITDVLILQNTYQVMYLETTGNWSNVQ